MHAMSANDDDKKALVDLLVRHGDAHRAQMVDLIQQTLRALAKAADGIADQHAGNEWTREWVELVKHAAIALRTAADHVQVPPLAPHGEVPS